MQHIQVTVTSSTPDMTTVLHINWYGRLIELIKFMNGGFLSGEWGEPVPHCFHRGQIHPIRVYISILLEVFEWTNETRWLFHSFRLKNHGPPQFALPQWSNYSVSTIKFRFKSHVVLSHSNPQARPFTSLVLKGHKIIM